MAWVWERSALVQCSVATSWPHPHAHDHQILTNIQAGSEQTVRQERGCISYLDAIKQSIFRLDMKVLTCFTSYETYFMVYGVNIFLTITKMSLSSGKLGGMPIGGISQWSTYVKNSKYVAISNQLCLHRALEYLGWKVESLLGKNTSQMSLFEKVRDR